MTEKQIENIFNLVRAAVLHQVTGLRALWQQKLRPASPSWADRS
jgi:hypothetical protein